MCIIEQSIGMIPMIAPMIQQVGVEVTSAVTKSRTFIQPVREFVSTVPVRLSVSRPHENGIVA